MQVDARFFGECRCQNIPMGSSPLSTSSVSTAIVSTSIAPTLDYLNKVHQRTTRVAHCIPPDKLEWSFREGKFTLGDLVRHIAAIERYMFAETIQGKPSRYAGCGPELADGYEAVMALRETLHTQTVEIISALGDEGLAGKCATPDGATITVWKWLRLLAEHEIHHRGQIYLYLAMLEVPTPPLYGLTSEELQQR
jgi:uncharacterized damage-inducible protein DinB